MCLFVKSMPPFDVLVSKNLINLNKFASVTVESYTVFGL
jgi:hypothetical protein